MIRFLFSIHRSPPFMVVSQPQFDRYLMYHGISHFRPREFSLLLMFSRLQVYRLVLLSMAESAPLHTGYDFSMIC